MAMTSEELVRHFLKLWEMRDAAGMVACFAEDGVYDNVPDRKPMVGRQAIRAWLDMVFAHIERIDIDILNLSSSGEWVLNERRDDHIAGDRHMVVEVMNATRVVDGQIVMFREYYDRERCREVGLG